MDRKNNLKLLKLPKNDHVKACMATVINEGIYGDRFDLIDEFLVELINYFGVGIEEGDAYWTDIHIQARRLRDSIADLGE